MDYSVIDELYEIYMNEYLYSAKGKFIAYLKKYHHHGENLKNILQSYIQEQTKSFPNFYESHKDTNNNVKNIVKNITSAFEYFVEPIHSFILSNIYEESDIEELKYDHSIVHRELTPNDLFNINMSLMEEAIENDEAFDIEDFQIVKDLIIYVKENKLLETLYSDGSWREMNFSELVESLYDKSTDKSIFEANYNLFFDYEETLFGKVKENCSKISTIEFDKYRSKLITTKQIKVDYGKLIFCRNLLMFYDTGIMPTNEGLLDCSIDYYESLNLIDEFKKLYSRNFNDEEFRKAQSNFICNPEIITTNYELKASKKVSFDNRILIGHLVTGSSSFVTASNYEIPYLIHIDIKDVNNPCSSYEIQLNLIPEADISSRLQLMRFDNWKSKGQHKNIRNKLNTTTHIHLYNQLDLIRGKKDGGFDIVYNFEDKSTEFETAFKTFLDILEFDSKLKSEIYNKTIKAINKLKSEIKTTDI